MNPNNQNPQPHPNNQYYQTFSAVNHHNVPLIGLAPNQIQPTTNLNLSSNTPRTEADFYATLRRYTERIREERDISLGYLNKINELT